MRIFLLISNIDRIHHLDSSIPVVPASYSSLLPPSKLNPGSSTPKPQTLIIMIRVMRQGEESISGSK